MNASYKAASGHKKTLEQQESASGCQVRQNNEHTKLLQNNTLIRPVKSIISDVLKEKQLNMIINYIKNAVI